MNDLYYIEYKPELMLSDSMDMDAETELAHRRLCDFIWRMDKPPKADNEFLKQFTKTKPQDWGRVKKGLLEKGWAEVDGLLLHTGAIETLNAAKEKYASQCNQTAPATAKKNGTELKLTVCERDPVTGIATLKVVLSGTAPVTPPAATSDTANVTRNVTTPQPEPELKPYTDSPPIPANRFAEVTDVEQAVAATMTAGIAEDFCRYVYRQWSMQSGRNANGVMVDWLPYVKGRWENERMEWQNGTHRGNRKTAVKRPESGQIREAIKVKSL